MCTQVEMGENRELAAAQSAILKQIIRLALVMKNRLKMLGAMRRPCKVNWVRRIYIITNTSQQNLKPQNGAGEVH